MRLNSPPSWLLLIHHIPPKPGYVRVKIGRRLQRVGAVALKNSVYVLPDEESCREDFQWIAREIMGDGGEAAMIEGRMVEGTSDQDVVQLFHQARNADYAAIAQGIRDTLEGAGGMQSEGTEQTRRALARFRKKLEEVKSMDHLQAPGRGEAEQMLAELQKAVRGAGKGRGRAAGGDDGAAAYQGRTWVTREGVKVDRIASAWLIRRFIDGDARFKFVAPSGYVPEPGEIRFDMFEAEFTHEGDACTFEVLRRRFAPEQGALAAIAEIVHDVDLKDGRYGRPEAAGLESMMAGIARGHASDTARLERGAALLDDLYGYFRDDPAPSAR